MNKPLYQSLGNKSMGREIGIPVSGDIDKDCRPSIPASGVHRVKASHWGWILATPGKV